MAIQSLKSVPIAGSHKWKSYCAHQVGRAATINNGPEQPSGRELLIDGRAPRAGEMMYMRTLGETMRGIAAEGKDYIYRGDFARKLSDHVQRYGGWITAAGHGESHQHLG